ncbi:opioid growth factor receptor conserved region-domain-containing protein, partial [Massariosphaeria phaeospora]
LLLRFYDPAVNAKDSHGRTLDEILQWNDASLERCHNYIQVLFPLPEGSPYNYEAPIITRDILEAFRAGTHLRDRLRQSFIRILEFYGFELQEEDAESTKEQPKHSTTEPGIAEQASPISSDDTETLTTTQLQSMRKIAVVRADHWQRAFRNWAVRFDHNHLRISRILRSLRVLGLQAECEAFYAALKEVFDSPRNQISDRSMMYWTNAVEFPLHVAPDGEKSQWLELWVEER